MCRYAHDRYCMHDGTGTKLTAQLCRKFTSSSPSSSSPPSSSVDPSALGRSLLVVRLTHELSASHGCILHHHAALPRFYLATLCFHYQCVCVCVCACACVRAFARVRVPDTAMHCDITLVYVCYLQYSRLPSPKQGQCYNQCVHCTEVDIRCHIVIEVWKSRGPSCIVLHR